MEGALISCSILCTSVMSRGGSLNPAAVLIDMPIVPGAPR